MTEQHGPVRQLLEAAFVVAERMGYNYPLYDDQPSDEGSRKFKAELDGDASAIRAEADKLDAELHLFASTVAGHNPTTTEPPVRWPVGERAAEQLARGWYSERVRLWGAHGLTLPEWGASASAQWAQEETLRCAAAVLRRLQAGAQGEREANEWACQSGQFLS